MATQSTSRDTAIANRRRIAGQMYLQGKTQTEIGIILRVSQVTISKDLSVLRKEWLQSALMDFNEAKSRELARIDVLEREAWEAYERSREKKVRTLAEKTTSAKFGEGKRSQMTEEDNYGDPRFLDTVRWCIEQRLKIFGIYAPQPIALFDVARLIETKARLLGVSPETVQSDPVLAELLNAPRVIDAQPIEQPK